MKPLATVRNIDGQIVLDDPEALGVIRAVSKHNCGLILESNAERVQHFTQRIIDRGLSDQDVVIVLLMVDDPNGGMLADALMPGHDWQAIRDRGEIPIARGLAGRQGIQEALEIFDSEAAIKLSLISGVAVVVVDQGVAEVYPQ